MLKKRILTAAVLIPLVLFGLFTLSANQIQLLSAVVFGWAAFEYGALVGIKTPHFSWLYLGLMAGAGFFVKTYADPYAILNIGLDLVGFGVF